MRRSEDSSAIWRGSYFSCSASGRVKLRASRLDKIGACQLLEVLPRAHFRRVDDRASADGTGRVREGGQASLRRAVRSGIVIERGQDNASSDVGR